MHCLHNIEKSMSDIENAFESNTVKEKWKEWRTNFKYRVFYKFYFMDNIYF